MVLVSKALARAQRHFDDNYVMLPREPSECMTAAGDEAIVAAIQPDTILDNKTPAEKCWEAMVAAHESTIKEYLIVPNDDVAQKYNELIMAVSKKFPNESRHDTALRFIRERELMSGTCKGIAAHGAGKEGK